MKTAILVLLMIFVLPLSVYAGSDLDKSSYELFYPIVAGKVPGDKWYSFKIFREKLVSFFLFNSSKKIEYHSSLSKKRLVEAEKLISTNKNLTLGLTTLEKSADELKTAWKIAQTKTDSVGDLKTDSQTIAAFMLRLADQLPSDEKLKVTTLSQSLLETAK